MQVELRRGATLVATVDVPDPPPLFIAYDHEWRREQDRRPPERFERRVRVELDRDRIPVCSLDDIEVPRTIPTVAVVYYESIEKG